MIDRRTFLATAALAAAMPATGREKPAGSLGIVIHSYAYRSRERDFNQPLRFLDFCQERRADGIQISLGQLSRDQAIALRTRAEKHVMYVEGSIRPPVSREDLERFEKELLISRECGAGVVRGVVSPGRRYEVFRSAKEFQTFEKEALASLRLAEPILARHRMILALENHKDYRAEEMAGVMKTIDSEFVGVCVDTGNNLALLESAGETVRALAPWARSCHLKDMALEPFADGFLLSEVPLGTGFLDLAGIIGVLRKANPGLRFSLEMITRDPLRIPCLKDDFWATLENLPARELARFLALIRDRASSTPLPRPGKLSRNEQLALEDENVRKSLRYGRETLGL